MLISCGPFFLAFTCEKRKNSLSQNVTSNYTDSFLSLGKIFVTELNRIAAEVRATVIELSHMGKTAHLGSSLSCVDILVALYWQHLNCTPATVDDPNRDRFILSKGHAATALYAVLAKRGFFPEKEMVNYSQPGSRLPEHPVRNCVPGVEATTGSLGHGLSLALGLAVAARLQRRSSRVYCLLSDGECNEGSVWEAALLAPAQRLDNLCLIVDFNKWQATGRSREVTQLEPLEQKFAAFGWAVHRVDGHSSADLVACLCRSKREDGRPTAIVADTVKGKGVSFMEDDNNWHYRVPTAAEVAEARRELDLESSCSLIDRVGLNQGDPQL